jgi:hypothetical protein
MQLMAAQASTLGGNLFGSRMAAKVWKNLRDIIAKRCSLMAPS